MVDYIKSVINGYNKIKGWMSSINIEITGIKNKIIYDSDKNSMIKEIIRSDIYNAIEEKKIIKSKREDKERLMVIKIEKERLRLLEIQRQQE